MFLFPSFDLHLSGIMVSVARILLAFCMVFTFPMECFVTRHCFLSIIEKILSDRNASQIDHSEDKKELSLNGVDEPSMNKYNRSEIEMKDINKNENENENEDGNENENEHGYFEGINPMTETVILNTQVRSSHARQKEYQNSNDLDNRDFSSSSATIRNHGNDSNNGNVLSNSNHFHDS